MLAIENCKGAVHVFSDEGDGGRSVGFYEIEPPIPDGDGSRALLLAIPLELQEITQPTVTLDDKRILYVFGTAWSSVTVSGILLLGQRETKGDQLTKLRQWYDENKVSSKKGPIRVSLGTSAIDAYVTGLALGQANPANNTQAFSIIAITADSKT